MGKDVAYYFSHKQRLDTLFAVHASFSLLIGAVGYLFPSSANVFFTTESDREYNLAKAIIRPYSTLIFAQGIMIWRARKIHDGEIKRVFVLAYFICFLFSTLYLIAEHLTNSGVVSGKIMGVMKIVSMMLLTAGYGWFTFFQPPAVFSGLATHYH